VNSSCDLDIDLDSMTLTCELDLHLLKVYLRVDNELFRSRLWKVEALQTQIYGNECITMSHLWVKKNNNHDNVYGAVIMT